MLIELLIVAAFFYIYHFLRIENIFIKFGHFSLNKIANKTGHNQKFKLDIEEKIKNNIKNKIKNLK